MLQPSNRRAKKESVKSQKYGQVQNAAICKVAKCKQRKKNGNFAMLAQVLRSFFSPPDICNTPFSNYH